MFLIGLTGGIASGKTTVAAIFASYGIPIVDADVMARKVVEPGKKCWHRLKKEFGNDIMQEDGTLNREKLAEVIFNDRVKRKKLNEITHPQIIKEMIWAVIALGFKGHSFVVMDIPLLYEAGDLVRFMHKVIVVGCNGDQQVERLLERTKMTKAQAEVRVAAQMPLDLKAEMAEYVVDNSGSPEETRRQVERIVLEIKRSNFHWKIRFYFFIAAAIFCVSGAFVLRFFWK